MNNSEQIKTQRQKVETLRVEVKAKQEQLASEERKLTDLEGQCWHAWEAPVADHIYHKGYTIEGDPPGTMGIDWRGPCDVPPRTEYRWRRTCKLCGKQESTTNVKTVAVQEPDFGGRG